MHGKVLHAGPVAAAAGTEPKPPAPSQAPTPSQVIAARAQETVRVTDAHGRVIGFRRLGVLDKLHMYQVLGAEDSRNETVVMAFALPACMTVEVDGAALPPVASRVALEGRLALLGDEGLNAILDYFAQAAEATSAGPDLKN